MLPRERALAAVEFRPVDVAPLEYHDSPAGLHEHGEKLKALWRKYPQDFNEWRDLPVPQPDPRFVDGQGQYREVRTDLWGAEWEYLIFGAAGHPLRRPLDDWANLPAFHAPPVPLTAGPQFEQEKANVARIRREYFLKTGWINIFEVMHAVRRFEDVLMDLATDAPEIHRLADIITDYQLGMIDYLVARGVDAVQMADDWGTQSNLIVSRKLFRSFFLPRYRLLVERIHAAGKKAFFHSCGYVWDILEDLAEIGMDAVWPQMQIFDERALACHCRQLRLAVAIQPDRAHMMNFGTPREVAASVKRLADTFRILEGGSWMYVEIDSGVPWPNVQALIEAVAQLR